MANSPAFLTSKKQGAGATIVSSSITPTTGRLLLAAVQSTKDSATAATVTLAGCGVTWVEVATRAKAGTDTWGHRVTLFRAMGTPTSGTLTATFAGGVSQDASAIQVCEFAGTDTTGTNGSGAVVQFASNDSASAASLTVTLAAFGNANNSTFGAFYSRNVNGLNVGTGFTAINEIHDGTAHSSLIEWKVSNDTTVDASVGTANVIIGIVIEIKAGPPTQTMQPTAIASTEAVNALTVGLGTVRPQPSSIPSAEAINALAITAKIVIAPATIVSEEVVSALPVLNQNFIVLDSAGWIGELVPDVVIAPRNTVLPASIVSTEAVQAVVIKVGFRVATDAIASEESVNPLADVILGLPHILLAPIPSAEAIGTLSINAFQTIEPAGVPSAEDVNAVVVRSVFVIAPVPVVSEEAVNPLTIHAIRAFAIVSVPSAEAFGVLKIDLQQAVSLIGGIPSEEAFTGMTVLASINVILDDVPSAEIVNALTNVTQGPPSLHIGDIPSEEAFGDLIIQLGFANWFFYTRGVDLGMMRLVPAGALSMPAIYERHDGLILLPPYNEEEGLVFP